MIGTARCLVFLLLTPFVFAAETQKVDAGADIRGVIPLQVTTDHSEFDNSVYVEDLLATVQRRWWSRTATPVLPVAVFEISRSGRIAGLRMERSSGNYEVDQAALKAITSAAPFAPLPATYTGQFLRVHLVFPPFRFASRIADAVLDSVRREGLSYLLGLDVPRNPTKGAAAYRTGAEAGDVKCMNNLAFLYEHGEAIPADRTLAVTWYRRAAEYGSAVAQIHLAWMYENGDGVDSDATAALSLYRQASRAENARIALTAREAIARLTR